MDSLYARDEGRLCMWIFRRFAIRVVFGKLSAKVLGCFIMVFVTNVPE